MFIIQTDQSFNLVMYMATKVFIVSAHPEPSSFNAAMADAGIQTFESMGAEVKHSDLYAMNFNPIASASDFAERRDEDYLNYALEQRHNSKSGGLSQDIQDELEKLMWCDLLVLNFPMWWCSVPAILKGWIDRVLVSGACYGGLRFYENGGMQGKQAMISMTAGAKPHMFADDGVHGDIQTMLKPLQQGTLAYVGFDVLPAFFAWHIPYITPEARAEVMLNYVEHLKNFSNLEPLELPKMSNFDKYLNPIKQP